MCPSKRIDSVPLEWVRLPHHRRSEFAAGIAEAPPFYGNTQDAKRELLLRYWRALPPELQSKLLVLTESMAHIYLGFDKRADLAGGKER